MLEGGIGKDVLTGGAGADRFVFPTVSESLSFRFSRQPNAHTSSRPQATIQNERKTL